MKKHAATLIVTAISYVAVGTGQVAAQGLELPQPLTSLLASGSHATSGGLRFSEFTIEPPESGAAIDIAMLEQLQVHDASTLGYGGLRLVWGSTGVSTDAFRPRRELTLSFEVDAVAPSRIEDVSVFLSGNATSQATAIASAYINDLTEVIDSLPSLNFFAGIPGPVLMASRFIDGGSQSVQKAGMTLYMVAESLTTGASATVSSVIMRVSNGEGCLLGDYDLSGFVDGRDFLLWQRTYGSDENLLADGNRDFSINAADLRIWQENYGARIGPPGDFDEDGDVDGRDFLAWQRANSPNPLSAGDLADWQSNYGSPNPMSTVYVPEPTTIGLILVGIVTVWITMRSWR